MNGRKRRWKFLVMLAALLGLQASAGPTPKRDVDVADAKNNLLFFHDQVRAVREPDAKAEDKRVKVFFQVHAAVYLIDSKAPGAADLIKAAKASAADKKLVHVTVVVDPRLIKRIGDTPDPARPKVEENK